MKSGYLRITWFWTLSIIQYSKKLENRTQHFGNWVYICPLVRGETAILLGP
jgi:hypothetical protein